MTDKKIDLFKRFDKKNNDRYLFLENFNNPYTQCPFCGQIPINVKGTNHTMCPSQHRFFNCPSCRDTRISDRMENILYCGLNHPYHICPIHQKPVIGPASYRQDKCTCQPVTSIIRQNHIKNWNSPFL